MADELKNAREMTDVEYAAFKAEVIGNPWRRMIDAADAADLARLNGKHNQKKD
jgi:hypothetical protein